MKKQLQNAFTKLAITASLLLCFGNVSAQWTQLGANLGFASNGAWPSLVINPSTNDPYIAYADGAANAFVVQKFDGTGWVKIGANIGFASNGATPILAFHPISNELYIAYADGAANAFVIQKFNGSAWVQVGANLGFAGNGSIPWLKFNSGTGEAYVTYRDGAANAFVVQRFNGNVWVPVGINLGFASNGAVATLSFSPSNEVYLAYPDGALHAYVVQKFNGTAWVQVGGNIGFASNMVAAVLAFNSTNEVFVAYPDGAANAFIVQKFNGTAWAQAGANLGFASGGSNNIITAPALTFNFFDNKLYVAYPDGATHAFFVQVWNGTAWVAQGSSIGSVGGNTSLSLAFKKCSAATYLAYSSSVGNAFMVQRYNPGCTLAITKEPKNETAAVGGKVQFSVAASYTCVNYQWQTDTGAGYRNVIDGGKYSGAIKDTLTVTGLTIANHNQPFRCIVKADVCADTSQAAILIINTSNIQGYGYNEAISVFPNPVHSYLSFNKAGAYTNQPYAVQDIYGRVLLRGIITVNVPINVNDLSQGVYFITVGDKNLQAIKFLKAE